MMTTAEKLTALRRAMARRGLAAYLVLTDDFHASEYVGDYFKAREYLSGFTGSAGTLLILPSRALLWTDGRYFLQAESQLAGSGIELMRMGQTSRRSSASCSRSWRTGACSASMPARSTPRLRGGSGISCAQSISALQGTKTSFYIIFCK